MRSGSVGTANAYRKAGGGFRSHVAGRYVTPYVIPVRAVEASAELDHDSFQVGVSGIINQVLELVEVIVDRPLALKIGGHFQDINGSGF